MKKLDSIWFWLADRYTGLKHGKCAIYDRGYDHGWDEGFDNGIVSSRKAVINKLAERDPKLNNPEFTLGYQQAVAVVKGDIE